MVVFRDRLIREREMIIPIYLGFTQIFRSRHMSDKMT